MHTMLAAMSAAGRGVYAEQPCQGSPDSMQPATRAVKTLSNRTPCPELTYLIAW
jgi:hypothetical protein